MAVESPVASRSLASAGSAPIGATGLATLRRLRPVILPMATAVAFLTLWQAVVEAFQVPAVVLPPPSVIARELAIAFPTLMHHALPATLDTLAEFTAAAVLGIGIAVALTYSPLLRHAIYPQSGRIPARPEDRAGAAVRRLVRDQQRVTDRLRRFYELFPGGDLGRSRVCRHRGGGGCAAR